MKNKHYTDETLPASIRTKSAKKLAGSRSNKPKHGVSKKNLEGWDKGRCGCGTLKAACRLDRTLGKYYLDPSRFVDRQITRDESYYLRKLFEIDLYPYRYSLNKF